ncbi:MAG: hypothetical protein ACPKPY_08810 [Nitrososphaeraceae archaeon]
MKFIDNDDIRISKIIIIKDKKELEKYTDDDFFLEKVFIKNDILETSISYNGGCKVHNFFLVGLVNKHMGVSEIPLYLFHNSNNDYCKKIVIENLYFNLLPLKKQIFNESINNKKIKLKIKNKIIEYRDR